MAEPSIQNLLKRLEGCMPIDRLRLGHRLRRTRRDRSGRAGHEEQLAAFEPSIIRDVEEAERRIERRRLSAPAVTFDARLPIAAHIDEIADAITRHQVIVVCGETGSGKTTQLPKICLKLGRGVQGMIGHTQPRRIAARSVAARIAWELGVELGGAAGRGGGGAVGYTVRFTDRAGPDTLVRIMTDGILLAETVRDRRLLQYDTIIIDEAHERSLNIDFLLGCLKHLLPSRPDLKVIITSATIDPARFSRHFDDAPMIQVGGRMHAVAISHRLVSAGDDLDEDEPAMLEAIARAIGDAGCEAPGDTLVFLSGEREIREAAKFLRGALPPEVEILPLYARLSAAEQNRVFEAHAQRRIVLATNVAETSLTVPGITSVVDPGLARISRYSPNARVQRLPVERISQASALQRAGRCGRVAPGACIRLYSEEDFAQRPAFTDPEILRSNLASVILQMKALRLGRIEDFPFIDKPRASGVREGLQTLHELAALDDDGDLTNLGRELAKMPVDPRLGRMILAARSEGSLREVLIVVSALASQDPRLRPLDVSSIADAAHAEFVDERSDFLTYVKIWDWWQTQSREMTSSRMRRLCENRYLSYVRMREWADVQRQLHALAMAAGIRSNSQPARYAEVHRALLTGLIGNVGMRADTFEYLGPSERRFAIFPGSSLFRSPPRWIMAAELVETKRLYARTVARIHPEWIEQLAPHLVKRTHSPPCWNARSAHVEADEKVSLRGLTLIPRRRVHYAKIDPALARETFIQHALVEGDYEPSTGARHGRSEGDDLLSDNKRLIASLRASEHKSRRRDVLVGPEALFAFYDARVPPDVCNGPAFEQWRRKAGRRRANLLRLTRSDLMRSGAVEVTEEQFPDSIEMGGEAQLRLPLEYRHEPGHADDGVTMMVPIEVLRQVREERCEWLVPGLLRDKIEALIKGLPKALRVNFIPTPDYAATVAANITFGVGVLTESIARELDRSTGVRIGRDAWRVAALPDHLRMNFRVINDKGETVASGRNLDAVRLQIGSAASEAIAMPGNDRFHRSGATHWEFGDIPERIALLRSGLEMNGYPALVDEGQSVGMRVLDSPEAAQGAHRAGLRRLFVLQVREELAMHVEYLPDLDQMRLHAATLAGGDDVERDLIDLIADRVFLRDDAAIRTAAEFTRRLDSGWDQLWTTASNVAEVAARILALHHDVDVRLTGVEDNPFMQEAVADIRRQLSSLMPRRFLVETPWKWLTHFSRFLNAIVIRMQKLNNAGLRRDHDATMAINDFWRRYHERHQKNIALGRIEPALDEFRWSIEDLRVSLFAQELRTSAPISQQRLERAWSALQA